MIRNQLYYSYYTFDLHSDFTFYLVDTVNGDESVRKTRNMFGYKGSYEHVGYVWSSRLKTETGIQFRGDATNHSALSHTKDRYILLNNIKLGNISEFSASAYVNETLRLNERFSINAGLRFDQFYYGYYNELTSDSSFQEQSVQSEYHSLNPKLVFYYRNENLQFYLSLGKVFIQTMRVPLPGKEICATATHGAADREPYLNLQKYDHPCRAMVCNAGPGKCL
jgi:outer membrane receptor for monomeric catechols